MRLARIREATVPLARAAQEVCDWLVEQANATVHRGLPGPLGMAILTQRMPRRGNVINIIPSELPCCHATASGLVYLAFASPDTADRSRPCRATTSPKPAART